MDENPNLLKMVFCKKIKVSWKCSLMIGVILCFFQASVFGQCGVVVPPKLVYIGNFTEANTINGPQIIQIPVINEKDSLRYISWDMPDELIQLNREKNVPQFDINKYDNSAIKKITIEGSCGIRGDQKVMIDLVFLPAVHPRNAVTGNSDSVNDYWDIVNLEKYVSPLPIVKVFDRWGNKVFESRDGYRTHRFYGYDLSGTKFLNTGSYIYSVIPHPDYPELIGELTLIR